MREIFFTRILSHICDFVSVRDRDNYWKILKLQQDSRYFEGKGMPNDLGQLIIFGKTLHFTAKICVFPFLKNSKMNFHHPLSKLLSPKKIKSLVVLQYRNRSRYRRRIICSHNGRSLLYLHLLERIMPCLLFFKICWFPALFQIFSQD